jgi:hypothetical protein
LEFKKEELHLFLVKRKGFDVGGDVEEASDPIEKRKKPLPSEGKT